LLKRSNYISSINIIIIVIFKIFLERIDILICCTGNEVIRIALIRRCNQINWCINFWFSLLWCVLCNYLWGLLIWFGCCGWCRWCWWCSWCWCCRIWISGEWRFGCWLIFLCIGIIIWCILFDIVIAIRIGIACIWDWCKCRSWRLYISVLYWVGIAVRTNHWFDRLGILSFRLWFLRFILCFYWFRRAIGRYLIVELLIAIDGTVRGSICIRTRRSISIGRRTVTACISIWFIIRWAIWSEKIARNIICIFFCGWSLTIARVLCIWWSRLCWWSWLFFCCGRGTFDWAILIWLDRNVRIRITTARCFLICGLINFWWWWIRRFYWGWFWLILLGFRCCGYCWCDRCWCFFICIIGCLFVLTATICVRLIIWLSIIWIFTIFGIIFYFWGIIFIIQ